VRVPDRDHELADAQTLGVTELGRGEVAAVRAQDRQVGEGIAADDRHLALAPVDERRTRSAVRACDHVRRGEEKPVRGYDHPATAARDDATAAHTPRDAEICDGGRQALGDGGDHTGVRVERLLLARLGRRTLVPLRPEQRVDERKIRHPVHASSGGKVCRWRRSSSSATAPY
jgi:hypothetical protein